MKKGTKGQWEQAIDAVFDNVGELDTLQVDAGRISQYRRMAQAMKAGFFEPTPSVVNMAKALLQAKPRKRLAWNLSPQSAMSAGARLAQGGETQFVLEGDGVRVRILLERTATGWDVTGQASGGPWIVAAEEGEVVTDESGRFVLSIVGPSSAFLLQNPESEIVVPAYEELADLGDDLDH